MRANVIKQSAPNTTKSSHRASSPFRNPACTHKPPPPPVSNPTSHKNTRTPRLLYTNLYQIYISSSSSSSVVYIQKHTHLCTGNYCQHSARRATLSAAAATSILNIYIYMDYVQHAKRSICI